MTEYGLPIADDSAEVYAEANGLNLDLFEGHLVIFKFPSTLDSLIDYIEKKSKQGLIETAPKRTIALVEYKFGVHPGSTENEFVNESKAIALVKKEYYDN